MTIPLVKVNNLHFHYRNSTTPSLDDISLEIRTGEIICITGPSGSGKSTFALSLCGFIPHNIAGKMTGEVILKGYSTEELTVTEISQLIGLVQQDPENQIVTSSVFEELAFGLENLCIPKAEIKERILNSAKALDIEDLLTRSTNELSGGEKQLVAIGSILTMQPEVVVMDECTAFLDNISVHRFIKILRNLNNNGKTIILIDHQPWKFKDLIDRLVILENGKIRNSYSKSQLKFEEFIIPREALQYVQNLPTTAKNTVLRFEKISVHLKKREILKNISLEFQEGRIYGIQGLNGSGKTTLLKTILNLIKYEGEIYINGKSTKKTSTHALAEEVGYVFQNPHHQLFEDTVLKEVQFGPNNFNLNMEKINKKINLLLEKTSLLRFKTSPPFNLSYGQKRRLNICSIEVYSPSILLLDEPFIALDKNNIQVILELLINRKKEGKTTIIVSHRNELLDLADSLIYLQDGCIKTESQFDRTNFQSKEGD